MFTGAVCSRCRRHYKKSALVNLFGGRNNVRSTGAIKFRCKCGITLRLEFIESRKPHGFFVVTGADYSDPKFVWRGEHA